MAGSSLDSDCSHVFLVISCNLSSLGTLYDNGIDHHSASTTVFAILLVTIIIGLIGNLLVVYVVCTKPNMVTAHNLYVVNLAIIDMLFLSVCSVVDEIGIGYLAFQDSFLLVSRDMSAAILFMQTVTFMATCGALMALAMERYLSIVRPLENKKRRTIRNTAISQGVVWTVAIVIGIIVSILESVDVTHHVAEGVAIYMFTVFFIGLAVFMISCYVAILRSVREHELVEGDRVARWQLRRNMQTLRMVNVLVVFFLIFRGFWIGYGLYIHHTPRSNTDVYARRVEIIVQIVSRLACALNSAINPFIYATLTSDFHKHLKQIIFHPFADSRPQRRGTLDSTRRSMVLTTSSIANSVTVDQSL